MAAFNLERMTEENNYYRDVIFTSKNQQLVLMCIDIGDSIPREIHENIDQFIRIERGKALVKIGDKERGVNLEYELEDGDSITIKGGTYHEVINSGDEYLKLYTIYSPPHHPPNTKQKKNIDKGRW